ERAALAGPRGRPAAAARVPHRRQARQRRRPAAQPREGGDRRVIGSGAASEIGIDVIETARIKGVLDRHDARFLGRVYTEWEQRYCRHNVLHLAGRWAAKEAVSKVLGLGVRGVGWREIEIKRTPMGQPTVTLHGRAEQRARALGLREPLSVSISHIRDLAVAVAVGLR